GFYANTGCNTEVVRALKARFGLPTPFLAVRRMSMVELTGGPVRSVSLSLAKEPIGRPVALERLVLRREQTRPTKLEVVGRLPDGSEWAIAEGGPPPWALRPRGRVGAAHRRGAERGAGPAVVGPLDPADRPVAAVRHPPGQRRHRDHRRPGAGRGGPGRPAGVPPVVGGGAGAAAGERDLPPGARRRPGAGDYRLRVRPVGVAGAAGPPGQA